MSNSPPITLADLRPAPYNPRSITPETIEALKRSLGQFGDLGSITWNRRTGNLVGGHQRMEALRQEHGNNLQVKMLDSSLAAVVTPAGETHYVRLVDWDEAKEKAANLASNNPHLQGDWDDEKLAAMLEELRGIDPSLFADMRFDELEADIRGTMAREGLTDPDEQPEPPEEPISRAGDLWLLGRHRLLCGDATNALDVGRLMDGAKARMAFTDPPYNVDYKGAAGSIQNDNLGSAFAAFLQAALRNLLEQTDGALYVCMSSSELDTLQAAFRAAGGHWSTFLIWAKSSFTLGRSDYQRQYEPILYGWREGAKRRWCGDRDQGDVWLYDKPSRSPLHPTQKPVDLVLRALANSSRNQDIVLDLFGGGGSTLIACEASGRIARVMEIDPRFVDVIVTRWENFTGKKATLQRNG